MRLIETGRRKGRGIAVGYFPNPEMVKRIENDFSYHTPKDDQAVRYQAIRDMAKQLAYMILELTPPSREQSSALTRLEEAVMHANAAIARNE